MSHSLRIRVAACLIAGGLAACGAPAPAPPEVETAEETAASEPASEVEAPATAATTRVRRERRATPPSDPTAYRYVDETGRVQVADSLGDIPERQRDTAVPIPGANSAPGMLRAPRTYAEATRPANSVDVTIYTTRSCPYCRAAIAYFEKQGIDYLNRDVQEDEDARADYLELTNDRPGVPVIVVGNEWMQGWDRESFDRLLKASE